MSIEYIRIIPKISYYLRSKTHIPNVLYNHKSPLFASGGSDWRIYIFSNTLEYMGSLCGHDWGIWCLHKLSNERILVSGSQDSTIKLWDIYNNNIVSTLYKHTGTVTALCEMGIGVLVSGSADKSIIIWDKIPGSSTYSYRHILTGNTSTIVGIFKCNNTEIISGEYNGDLRIWNIAHCTCTRHISNSYGIYLCQMKQINYCEVAVSYKNKLLIFWAENNWESSYKKFSGKTGYSIELLSPDIMLRETTKGIVEFIDYAKLGISLPPPIQELEFATITDILRIGKNMVVISSNIGILRVIDPIERICYLKFRRDKREIRRLSKLYQLL